MPRRYLGSFVTYNPVEPTALAASGMWPLNQQLQEVAAGTWPLGFGDPYFPYTTLLLSSTALSNASNNLFVDSSGVFSPISRNGNTTQGSFAPYGTYWSNYFPGTVGSYLSAPNNAAFQFGTGDVTIESWFCLTGNSVSSPDGSRHATICAAIGASGVSNDFWFFVKGNTTTTGTGIVVVAYNGGSQTALFDTAYSFNKGVWYHVAFTRSGNNTYLFVNGSLIASSTYAGTITAGSNPLNIGYAQTGSINYNCPFFGYLSNLRIVKGTALYTSAFTPSAYPLTAVSGTSILTCQSNRFRDASTNNFTITPTGSVNVTNFSPFLHTAPIQYNQSDITNWSGYFDGTGDLLSTPTSSALGLTGDWTVETWVYPTSYAAGANAFFDNRAAGTGCGLYYSLTSYTGGPGAVGYATNTALVAVSTIAIPLFAWTHIAFTRSGNTITCYINGTSNFTYTDARAFASSANYDLGNSTHPPQGYMAGYRVVRGTAVYTGNFTPPTSPLTAVSGTSLLTMQDAAFTDRSTNNLVLSVSGNPTVTGNSPFNTVGYWSNYFDGNGDNLTLPSSSSYAIASSSTPFTIEAWIYPTAGGGCVFSEIFTGSGTIPIVISMSDGSAVDNLGGLYIAFGWFTGSAWVTAAIASSAVTANTWTHIACVFTGSTTKIYYNGVDVTKTSSPTPASSWGITGVAGDGWYIGRRWDGAGSNWFSGYISNIRFVNGTAVYTSAFTPPTAPLTAITNTVLLTCQSSRFVDTSAGNAAITVVGNTSVQSFNPFYSSTIASNGGSMYFDGSGDFLTSVSPNFAFGTGAWTVEFWVYPLAYGGSVCGAQLFGTTNGGTSGYSINLGQDINSFRLISNASGSWADNLSVGTGNGPPLNAWSHMVVVRSGANISIYKNGTRVATTGSASSWNFSGTTATIGRFNDGSNVRDLSGYLSNLRVTGAAVYDPTQSTISVPTAPVNPTAASVIMPNGMNAGIYDATAINDMETVGNAQVTTAVSKYGGSSVYFPAYTSYLNSPFSQTAVFGTGDFTIEAWIYSVAATAGYTCIFSSRDGISSNANAVFFGLKPNTNQMTFFTSSEIIGTSTAVSTGVWTHVALVRNSGATAIYINGVSSGTATFTTTLTGTGASIGNEYNQATGYNGGLYVDDLRITKGIARYTSNFTPPTAALPTY